MRRMPDLVIYLQAPIDVLIERIERRGIRYEQHIEREYLEKLQEAYARFFHAYDASPLLIVNAAQADFVSNERDYAQLLEPDPAHSPRPSLLQSVEECRLTGRRGTLASPGGATQWPRAGLGLISTNPSVILAASSRHSPRHLMYKHLQERYAPRPPVNVATLVRMKAEGEKIAASPPTTRASPRWSTTPASTWCWSAIRSAWSSRATTRRCR